MSEDRSSITAAVTAILEDLSTPENVRRTEEQGWNPELWSVLTGTGFTAISVPEDAGGSGGDIADAGAVIMELGRFAAAVPVAETGLLAGWALTTSGLPVPDGPVTVGGSAPGDSVKLVRRGSGWHVDGRLHRVPWAVQAGHVVVLARADEVDQVVCLRTGDLEVIPGCNLAGESRDTVVLDGAVPERVAPAGAGVDIDQLRLRGALARAVAMAGALARITDLTVSYTSSRRQFGRPVSRFQAVQRHLVRIAERSVSTGIAAEAACLNADPAPDFFDVASAKIVAGESATLAAAASHQAHGAIGMTKEYELGQLSRRLWSWRDEFGSESYWSRVLGRHLARAGADRLWPRITVGRSDRDLATTSA